MSLVTTSELILIHYYYPKSTLYSDLLSFYLMTFSAPGSHPGDCITLSHHVSLGSPRLWQFHRLSMFLITLKVSRNSVWYFVGCPWNLSDVFFMIRLGLCVWGRKSTEIKCHSRVITVRVHAINMIYHSWCWPWSPGWGTTTRSPSTPYSLEESSCA